MGRTKDRQKKDKNEKINFLLCLHVLSFELLTNYLVFFFKLNFSVGDKICLANFGLIPNLTPLLEVHMELLNVFQKHFIVQSTA